MESVRRYVFPIVWMLIFAVIALALAKLAFFPSGAVPGEGDDLYPTAEFDQYATVMPETGDISSTMGLDAMVQPDAGTPVLAKHSGEITKIWVKNGDTVAKGDRILQVRVPQEPAPMAAAPVGPDEIGPEEIGPDGEPVPVAAPEVDPSPAVEYLYLNLVAPEAGKITGLSLAEWQSTTAGETVATLSPGTYSIVASLSPEQQLQLLDLDINATADLPTAKDPVPCAAPSITEDEKVEEPGEPQIDPMTGMEQDTSVSAAQLRCPVPEGTKIVPGLSVKVTVDLGSATGVMTVPTTAVEGNGTDGSVYVMEEATGEPALVPVTLGLRGDGVVQIVDGLEEGQEILQFVPGVDNPDGGMFGGGMW